MHPLPTPTPQGPEMCTLLVVDDDEPIRDLLERTLAGAGYRVLVAQDARDALHICHTHDGPITLAVADIVLPGMNGYVLADCLAAKRSEIRVLFLTGHPTVLDSVQRQDAAFHWALLQKPFSRGELLDRVRDTLQVPPYPHG